MILWCNPFNGISGDMLLGALIDLGAPVDGIRDAVASTGITGWTLAAERVRRGGLGATRAVVGVTDTATERRAAQLLELIGHARPAPVAQLAAAAVTAIAGVEGRLHAADPDQVALHEIGGLDTVVDTVGVAAALHLLGVTEVHCGPLGLGAGSVATRHGALPAPAPATLALLAEAGAEITGAGLDGETVTPTGAALLLAAGARYGALPAMTLRGAGYGAGSKQFEDRPNVLQVVLGSRSPTAASFVLLETNVDDVTGEVLGHLIGVALQAGAADVWVSPIVMKKNRPAHTVHVLAPPERAAQLERLVLAETGSLGLRRSHVDRLALPRSDSTVDVDGHPIRVKRGPWGAKPEHDDVVAAAVALDVPVRVVADRARRESAGADDLDLGRAP
ncbi:MAG: nickel pincer cofactor biosynthesis protein LarC [Pseudonocardiaceae bacterium]|nr:nickel pincer cofactor biosynthesis protein LarC [Pseudonocardiaceae bacterium]